MHSDREYSEQTILKLITFSETGVNYDDVAEN
jgi:hypothetical protein